MVSNVTFAWAMLAPPHPTNRLSTANKMRRFIFIHNFLLDWATCLWPQCRDYHRKTLRPESRTLLSLFGYVEMAPIDRWFSFVAREVLNVPRLPCYPLNALSRVCVPLPRLTFLPAAPILARSIAAPAPGLVRPYLRRPGSTDRSLPGARTAPRFRGLGAGREPSAS